jgi:hypothetical protein
VELKYLSSREKGSAYLSQSPVSRIEIGTFMILQLQIVV